MKRYRYYSGCLNVILLVLLFGCKHHKNQSAVSLFSIRNITYDNPNFIPATVICNTASKPFLSLNTINKDGSVVGSIFKSASGNSNSDCKSYPILFNNNLVNADIQNNSLFVSSAIQIGNNSKTTMIAGLANDTNNMTYMPFDALQPIVIQDQVGYDSASLSPLGDFIAGVSILSPYSSKPVLYNIAQSPRQIDVKIGANNFNGSLFNIGVDDVQHNSPLIFTGYQYINNSYNALVCSLKSNDTNADCVVSIPDYISLDNTKAMPINIFVAPDASVIYAVKNNKINTSSAQNSTNIVVSIDPLNPTKSPLEISALNVYNIESINYVSVGSRNPQGVLTYGGVISIFTSADVGHPQYVMILNNFGKYQILPLAMLLSNLGVKTPNNYQFIAADPNFQYILLKNTVNFSSPRAGNTLYTVIKFNNYGSQYINSKFTNDLGVDAQVALIQSFLNPKE